MFKFNFCDNDQLVTKFGQLHDLLHGCYFLAQTIDLYKILMSLDIC